jgi:hypothetical protein
MLARQLGAEGPKVVDFISQNAFWVLFDGIYEGFVGYDAGYTRDMTGYPGI